MGGWGGLVKLKLKLNSAKAEAQASSLSLAELGNKSFFYSFAMYIISYLTPIDS